MKLSTIIAVSTAIVLTGCGDNRIAIDTTKAPDASIAAAIQPADVCTPVCHGDPNCRCAIISKGPAQCGFQPTLEIDYIASGNPGADLNTYLNAQYNGCPGYVCWDIGHYSTGNGWSRPYVDSANKMHLTVGSFDGSTTSARLKCAPYLGGSGQASILVTPQYAATGSLLNVTPISDCTNSTCYSVVRSWEGDYLNGAAWVGVTLDGNGHQQATAYSSPGATAAYIEVLTFHYASDHSSGFGAFVPSINGTVVLQPSGGWAVEGFTRLGERETQITWPTGVPAMGSTHAGASIGQDLLTL